MKVVPDILVMVSVWYVHVKAVIIKSRLFTERENDLYSQYLTIMNTVVQSVLITVKSLL